MKTKFNFIKRHKVFFSSLLITIFVFYMILYGPFDYFRETWITSAITTMKHDWLALMIYDKKTIDEIKSRNYFIEPKENTDVSLISFDEENKKKGIEIETVKGGTYTGYMMKVYDPSLVRLVVTESDDTRGLKVREFVDRFEAIGGINCASFVDNDGHSDGGEPEGLIMSDGEIFHDTHNDKFHIIGINSDNKLVLGDFTRQGLIDNKIRDAMEFQPYLVVNGKPATFYGNGGAGLAPRTAIGQTADGTFLLLVIDGRQLSTLGATFKDLQDVMLEFGAVNAANVDGGSSSLMYYNGKTVNFPINTLEGRYLPASIIVMPPELENDIADITEVE